MLFVYGLRSSTPFAFVVSITLVQLMDNFRVSEPIILHSAEAEATSLRVAIFGHLTDDMMLFGSGAATSMTTVVGVCILLTSVLIRTRRDVDRRRAHRAPHPKPSICRAFRFGRSPRSIVLWLALAIGPFIWTV
ncbi:MAG: hypothetical protein ACU0CI_11605 [Shimia sp.]